MRTNCRCQNCGETWAIDQLREVADLGQRVAPGDHMPAGECPACGAVCHEFHTYTFTSSDGNQSFEVEEISEASAALDVLRRLGWGLVLVD